METMNGNNGAIWMRHLHRMTQFAQQRRQHEAELADLATKHYYVRIGGNGFR